MKNKLKEESYNKQRKKERKKIGLQIIDFHSILIYFINTCTNLSQEFNINQGM